MLHNECGFTPLQVREMTLFDIERLNRHWEKVPPLRLIVMGVAKSLGVEFNLTQGKPKEPTAREAEAMIRMVNAVGGGH